MADLLTQLDSEVDLLLKIMSSSIAYVSRKAQHQPLPYDDNPAAAAIPLTILGQTEAISPQEMHESAAELVSDLVNKASEIKAIILHLPDTNSAADTGSSAADVDDVQLRSDLHTLERELHDANAEYEAASAQAADLHAAISSLLAQVCAHQQDVTAWLASSSTTNTT